MYSEHSSGWKMSLFHFFLESFVIRIRFLFQTWCTEHQNKSLKTHFHPWVKKRSYQRTNIIMSALSFMTPSHNMIIFSRRHRFRHLICSIQSLFMHYSCASLIITFNPASASRLWKIFTSVVQLKYLLLQQLYRSN